ncbi:MAG: MliC family protein [Patescibacteria group bacterium]|nr:MliC family protein [Patescibacteria group bacterium]
MQSYRGAQSDENRPIAEVSYQCDGGKTIQAAYYAGETKPAAAPGQPPTPGGSVALRLSDGRTLDLYQTISADGARYSDGNPSVQGSESIVFWSKGNGAMVLEHNTDLTYSGCVKIAPNPGDLPLIYTNGADGFSIRYPADYTLDSAYSYQALGPGKDIAGVKFTIPESFAKGTNLSDDTYLSVEEIPQAKQCTADLFMYAGALRGHAPVTLADGDTTYSVASSTDAAVGNRYEETLYAIPGSNPCIAVRYFIHYGVLENYPPGMVTAFDHAALTKQFDEMRRTLVLN